MEDDDAYCQSGAADNNAAYPRGVREKTTLPIAMAAGPNMTPHIAVAARWTTTPYNTVVERQTIMLCIAEVARWKTMRRLKTVMPITKVAWQATPPRFLVLVRTKPAPPIIMVVQPKTMPRIAMAVRQTSMLRNAMAVQ